MRTHTVFLIALLTVASALQAALVFDLTTTTVTATPPASVGVFGANTITSTSLPISNGITGFKLAGSAAAENKASTVCTTCELTVRAGRNLTSSGLGIVLPAPVPMSWSFRVDEIATPGHKDGTSNFINGLTTLPPTRTRPAENGGVPDGTSNTIFFGETTTQQIASGNRCYGDEIAGAGSFLLQNRIGLFTLELHILPTNLGVDRGILLTMPQDSFDLNPPDFVPEPSAIALTLAGTIRKSKLHYFFRVLATLESSAAIAA